MDDNQWVELTRRNRALVTDFVTLALANHHIRDAFMRYVAPHYIQHSPIVPDGRDNAIAVLSRSIDANPGFTYELQRVIADGDIVAAHARAQFPGHNPRAIVDIFRIEDGLIVEHWDIVQEVLASAANPRSMF